MRDAKIAGAFFKIRSAVVVVGERSNRSCTVQKRERGKTQTGGFFVFSYLVASIPSREPLRGDLFAQGFDICAAYSAKQSYHRFSPFFLLICLNDLIFYQNFDKIF